MNNAMPTIAEIELSAKSSNYEWWLNSVERDIVPPGEREIRSLQFLVSNVIQKIWLRQFLLRLTHGMKVFRTKNSKDCRRIEIGEKVAWNPKYWNDVQKEEDFS